MTPKEGGRDVSDMGECKYCRKKLPWSGFDQVCFECAVAGKKEEEKISDKEIELCPECGQEIGNNDFTFDYETSEYHGAPATERITSGFVCPKCGYREEY